MPDTVLIEVATALPEWVFSWWHIGIPVLLVILVWGFIFWVTDSIIDTMGASTFITVLIAFLWIFTWAPMVNSHIPDEEAVRVASQISEVTGVDVSAEQVQDMQDGGYVPGVNYDRLTDSDGDLVFKVEVK